MLKKSKIDNETFEMYKNAHKGKILSVYTHVDSTNTIQNHIICDKENKVLSIISLSEDGEINLSKEQAQIEVDSFVKRDSAPVLQNNNLFARVFKTNKTAVEAFEAKEFKDKTFEDFCKKNKITDVESFKSFVRNSLSTKKFLENQEVVGNTLGEIARRSYFKK